ncbi:hypothetical protein GCM10023322_61740 [Rugosimonospora acidiphila]|uniref:Phosphatidylserine/phosphatidylglycerophosphate/ cardiolipin synthase family protein n=1 Tax=Rugosimonospora acidiphila TaxID=556531 RepID=A0ABP9SHD7_9ACTN
MSQIGRPEAVTVKSTVPRKIVITLVTSGVAYLITALVQASQIWPVVLATFIGGVAVVVQFLVDFDARLQTVELSQESRLHALHDVQQGHTVEMERLVRNGFLKINEATELFGLVETSALRTDVVTQFVRNATRIDPEPSLLFDFAQAEIYRMSKFLKELSTGEHVSYDGEDRDWLLGLARHARTSIDATSLTTVDASAESGSGGLWNSDLGARYLEVQREAIARGVKVRRVFILNRSGPSRYPNLPEICRIQHDLGIQVRILFAQEISGLLRNSLFDFIIFDDVLSYEVTPGSRLESQDHAVLLGTHLILGRDRVEERTRRFNNLWESATAFED